MTSPRKWVELGFGHRFPGCKPRKEQKGQVVLGTHYSPFMNNRCVGAATMRSPVSSRSKLSHRRGCIGERRAEVNSEEDYSVETLLLLQI